MHWFQSRNRDTSIFRRLEGANAAPGRLKFQSRNRDTSIFRLSTSLSIQTTMVRFQSRNRDTSIFRDFEFVNSTTKISLVSIS